MNSKVFFWETGKALTVKCRTDTHSGKKQTRLQKYTSTVKIHRQKQPTKEYVKHLSLQAANIHTRRIYKPRCARPTALLVLEVWWLSQQ